MDKLRNVFFLGIFSLFISDLFATTVTDEELPPNSVGYFEEEEEDEVVDRDRDKPSFYERNRMSLMHKRDRQLRKEGKCCPPPNVIVSPEVYVPRPAQQVQARPAERQ